MPSPTAASLPERLADAEGELPEEIVTAIRALEIAAEKLGGHTWIAAGDGAAVIKAQALFSATILARLTAAEGAREAAVARAERAEKALRRATNELEEIVSFTLTERCCLREQEIASIATVAEASRAALAHPATAEET